MSKKSKSAQIPLFIGKIYEMIEDKKNAEAIDWTSNNDSFSIKNITKFTEEVLPEYFKHRNFASFIRQLNMYGFKKIRHSEGQNVYMNQNFKAGAKSLLKNINRKNKQEKDQQLEVYRTGNSGRLQAPISKQIHQLKTNQRNLQEMCRYFMNQNQRILEQNQNFVKRLDSQEKEKEEKLQQILIYLLTQRSTNTLLNSSANQPQLSIANEQYQGEHSQFSFKNEQGNSLSPLQQIDRAIREKEQLNNVRNMIRDIYSKKQRNKEPNFSIQNHEVINKKDANFNGYIQKSQYSDQNSNHNGQEVKEGQRDDRSFFSINDFLNAEDQHNPQNPLFQA